MKFTETLLYKEIQSSEKTYTVPFYSNTGITVTSDNVYDIIELEISKSKNKMNVLDAQIKEQMGLNMDKISEIISNRYMSQINHPYLIIEYAYLNKDNVDAGSTTIEQTANFYKWLVS